MADPPEILLPQYYHIALPRDVPGRADRNLHHVESALLDRIIKAVKTVVSHTPLEQQPLVDAIRVTLSTSKALNVDGKVDKNLLAKEINSLEGNHALILYICEQNAALLIHKDSSESGDDLLVFEAFETSAVCEKVLAAPSALRWNFPTRAASVPAAVHGQQAFQDRLAAFLEQASIESVKHFAAITCKASAAIPEIRNTTDPSLITGFLMTVLEANGGKAEVPLLQKRVRDTVSFEQAKQPWRRSPFYLAIRVAVQRQLYKIMGPDVGHLYYKIIMALVVSDLLSDCYHFIPHEASFFMMQKLGRRLAKIESYHSCGQDPLFLNLRGRFQKTLEITKSHLETQWRQFREITRRPIRPVPIRADKLSLVLQLPYSGQLLMDIAFSGPWNLPIQGLSPYQLLEQYESSRSQTKPFAAVAHRYLQLAVKSENEIAPVISRSTAHEDWNDQCCHVARTINSSVTATGQVYNDYPELKSGFLLDMMELWVEMDRQAIIGFPLLKSYHPGFNADILDSLEIMYHEDMKRVQEVQQYLTHRCRDSRPNTIFDPPSEESFSVVFYNTRGEAAGMTQLRDSINSKAEKAREAKEQEWRMLSQEHERLMQQVAESSCPYVYEKQADGTFERVHAKGCPKHRYKWQAKQIKIKIFEHPLPHNEPAAKASVFELKCPEPFAAYRDATWLLISTFAQPPTKRCGNVPILRNYSGLTSHAKPMKTQVTLGSTTKSHLDCHYAETGFPVTLSLVCRPCGLTLDYFDTLNQSWTTKDQSQSFSRHLRLMLPSNSPYRSFDVSSGRWPTSNEIIASQTKCPSELNVHEYMAWQDLLSGTNSRWFSLLREMGGTNLNFSTESTSAIVSKINLQVGPSSTLNVLRDIHVVFDDEYFCERLLEQVSHRMGTIQKNWRESIQMDVLISLTLKTMSLSSSHTIRKKSLEILSQARKITWEWCVTLQKSTTTNSHESTVLTLWASVLCKRTVHGSKRSMLQLDSESIRYFVGASIILHENLVGSFEHLPCMLRNLVIQDLLFTYSHRENLEKLLMTERAVFISTVDHFCQLPPGSYSNARISSIPAMQWIEIVVPVKNQSIPCLIHYHVVRGDLLINGQQSGFLPAEYHLPAIQSLFGTHALRVRPSYLPGMSLFIAQPMPKGHWVHLGFRRGRLVIRAVQSDNLLELIDPSIFRRQFGKEPSYDLPFALVDKCYHWLDLRCKVIEIRQDIWKSTPSNWRLNLVTRQATKKNSFLVDPFSTVAQTIARNFQYFEYGHHITVTQPQRGHISIEMKRLELSFFVNNRQLLQCRELDAELTYTELQDVGTWYGLHSKIVLRSMKNTKQRLILVPDGPILSKVWHEHVKIYVEPNGKYFRFDVDDVLGRIQCPAEHRLLYTKAMWHAHTAYPLPDPLTGRTGSAEALSLLCSGLYKPWTPLKGPEIDVLIKIANLSPNREYYPASLKNMETVHWNTQHTKTIQNDQYRSIVEKILDLSAQLKLFAWNSVEEHSQSIRPGNSHLEARSIARSNITASKADHVYIPRGFAPDGIEQQRVHAVTSSFVDWSMRVMNTEHLVEELHGFPVIGGLNVPFNPIQISDLISVSVVESWGALMLASLQAASNDRYDLMFIFGPMVLSSSVPMDLIQVLVSCAVLDDLKEIKRPTWPSYVNFKSDEIPAAADLADLMKDSHQPPRHLSARKGQVALARIKHEEACAHHCFQLAKSICSQWPQVDIDVTKLLAMDPELLDTENVLDVALSEWKRLAQNFEFSNFLRQVQQILDGHSVSIDTSTCEDRIEAQVIPNVTVYPVWECPDFPTIQSLLGKSIGLHDWDRADKSLQNGETTQRGDQLTQLSNGRFKPPNAIKTNIAETKKQTNELKELDGIVTVLQQSTSHVQQEYGLELQQSCAALSERIAHPPPHLEPMNPAALDLEIKNATLACNEMFGDISQALQCDDRRASWLKICGLWPTATKPVLLTELRSTSNTVFGEGTKEALVTLAVQVTQLQRLLRIEDSLKKSRVQQLHEERINPGHTNWNPLHQTDWLLLEVDSNIMIRAEQVKVANATISPGSGRNSVSQLLMGRGKTSTILPMVAAVLANRKQLLRILVPRALLLQSAQVMHIKLGGLLDRELMHIPFSRKLKPNSHSLKTFGQLHFNLKKNGGIMLSLPESILSFKLSGLQHLCDGATDQGRIMIKMQEWLNQNARDVLDECDVSLAIRTQLIYPSGSQAAVDGHPLRWQTIQAVLRLLRLHLPELERHFPHSIEIVKRPVGDFPLIYLLRKDVADYMVSRIVDDVCKGQLAALPCAELPRSSQDCIRTFISSEKVTPETVVRVEAMFKDKQHIMKTLYLLRGLFVHRIFLSTLRKRWNVQYGLHPTRDPIAVPYHAKGVPSPTSEWGHPDVGIILTCLSFYYQGLNLHQLKQAFAQLLKSDEPSIEYDKWATKSLPDSLRDYNSINAEDDLQLSELHQHIRFNVFLIDYFMNNFVFPRHARQFDTKLQASGWDLVLFDPARMDSCRTTGFSGTNDSRHQLPMTIKQADLSDLAHTNAEVLSYLLQPRSRQYVRMVDGAGRRLSEEGLLTRLSRKHGIRILIDAGAQILEHDNLGLVKAWLKIDWEAKAAVYFDNDHRPWVLYQKGQRVPLLASPFAEDLDGCVVYLDESHCRGTDLKLPPGARAALTLGPHVTKDGIAQAAMRLRLLGQSQSITFFSPPEVHQSVLDLREKPESYKIDSSDVIAWLLQQSCNGIEQLEPLYYNQGNTFVQQEQAKIKFPLYLTNVHQRSEYLSVVRTKESHSLKQMYEPKRRQKHDHTSATISNAKLKGFDNALAGRKENFQDRGLAIHSSALEEVEQEREIEHEVENVRELEVPFHVTGLRISPLHRDIVLFARSGKIQDSEAYRSMFVALQQTACGTKHGPFAVAIAKRSNLFISTQFSKTVKIAELNDNFIRPCHWVIWSPAANKALVISPEEADALIPMIRRFVHVKDTPSSQTHLIVYSAPVTRRMLHFNNLDYHATPPLPRKTKVPTWLKIELGIFSGKLYFEWSEYQALLGYLGITMGSEQETRLSDASEETFVKKPLTFLHDWLSMLRKGQDFEHTPMGFVTTSKPLSEDHPFFHINAKDHESDNQAKFDLLPTSQEQEEQEDSDVDGDDDDDYHQEDQIDHVDDDDVKGRFEENENAFFDASSESGSDGDDEVTDE